MTVTATPSGSRRDEPIADLLHKLMVDIEGERVKMRTKALIKAAERLGELDPTGWEDPVFDSKLHLSISPPKKSYTFEDLGLSMPGLATSPVAGTSPFPVFSAASIPLIRKALLNPRYLKNTAYIFSSKTLIVRNTAAYSPFFRRLWTHPDVLSALSQAAGVELEPVMTTFELGHGNVQIDVSRYQGMKHEEKLRAIAYDLTDDGFIGRHTVIGEGPPARSEEEIRKAVEGEGSLLPWHYDSYPWVCVVMISDTSTMIGGETVIQQGNGVYKGISQPGMGSGVMLQGGFVRHLALPSSSGNERITIITSFRPKRVDIYESSFMCNIRPYSVRVLDKLYHQWLESRYARLHPGIEKLQYRRLFLRCSDGNDSEEEQRELTVLKEYAKRTMRQMVPESRVRNIVNKYGCNLFYTICEDYVTGRVFPEPWKLCHLCNVVGAVVNKAHLAICAGARKWDPDSPLWSDCLETAAALKEGRLLEQFQNESVVTKWKDEKRKWGIADEMALQGLVEYLIEFLELSGVLLKTPMLQTSYVVMETDSELFGYSAQL